MALQWEDLPGGTGASVHGLDIEEGIDEATASDLYALWLDKGILLFPGLGVSPEAQLGLSRCFGELEVHPIEDIRVEGYPELIWLASAGKRTAPVYRYEGVETVGRIPWHTDLVYTTTPNRGALLRMLVKPASGGQTGWLDTAAAYDALPQSMKERIEGLEARFQFILDPREMRFARPDVELVSTGDIQFPEFPDIAHPLVWQHPESGRKSLCLSTLHLRDMIGLDLAEGDALLHELVAHCLQPQFSYIHDWQVGDMVLWDNWRTMHTALGHAPGLDRLVHRTTIRGAHGFGRVIEDAAACSASVLPAS